MLQVSLRLVANIASIVTILAFMVSIERPSQVLEVGIALLAILLTVLVVWDAWSTIRKYRRTFEPNSAGIKTYMRDLLRRGGASTIFTRDMSWADESETLRVLEQKARRNELTLYLPNSTKLTDRLRHLGADVRVYPSLGYTPSSRFTIINAGRMDACVAVGGPFGKKHLIREFQIGEHPFFSVAQDLLEVLDRISEKVESSGK